jgi:myo-inositol catabolism protein IolC
MTAVVRCASFDHSVNRCNERRSSTCRGVVITGLNADATRLVVEFWTPGRGLRRVERD